MDLTSSDLAAFTAALDLLDNDAKAEQWRHDGPLWVKDRLGEFLWSKQIEILNSVRDHRYTAVQACHGPGKMVARGTPHWGPDGWILTEDIRVGTRLHDEAGRVCTVTALSPWWRQQMYRVVFSDGAVVDAGQSHEWCVLDLQTRRRGVVDWRDHWDDTRTCTTEELFKLGTRTPSGQNRWRIPLARPLHGEHADLPLSPYLLGFWLGDGHTRAGVLTIGESKLPLLSWLDDHGVAYRVRRDERGPHRYNVSLYGIAGILRELGLLNNKHIPHAYLAASETQRRELLAGLMDSDGFLMHPDGCDVGIDLCDRRLADDVAHLVRTLGCSIRVTEGVAAYTLDGERRVTGTRHRATWRPLTNPFKVRNTEWVDNPRQRSRHTLRTIVSIDPLVPDVSRCIEVDSARHLYLTGRDLIPTHNSRLASRAAAWWMETHPPGTAKVVSTAPTFRQVETILWGEINDAAQRAQSLERPFNGRVLATEWKIGNRVMAFGQKPSDHNLHAFQGQHATYLLMIIDEACGVVSQFWKAARALMTGPHCRLLALGNPDDPGSEFAKNCASPRWNVIKISALDTPNFTGEPVPDALRDVLVDQVYVDDMAEEYGEDSPTYISKVLGEFPSEADDGVVRLSALRRCCLPQQTPRTPDEELPVELGVDFGAGGDETVIRERRGVVVGREWRTSTKEAMEVVGLALQAIRETGATRVKCDYVGIGWAAGARLRELGRDGAHDAEIIDVDVRTTSSKPGKFTRLRSELWWDVARHLSEDGGWDLSGLDEKDRERLVSQLCAPKYVRDSSGRVVVEKKEDTKARIGRSPDNADALILAFYSPPAGFGAAADWLSGYRDASRHPARTA